VERKQKLEEDLKVTRQTADELTVIWQSCLFILLFLASSDPYLTFSLPVERARLNRVKDVKKRLEEAKYEFEVSQRQGNSNVPAGFRFSTIPDLERQLPKEQKSIRVQMILDSPLSMLHERVTSNDISTGCGEATGYQCRI